MKYVTRSEGEWIKVKGRIHTIRCCDCRLVHVLEFRVRDDGKHIEFRSWRNNRATAASRRKKSNCDLLSITR